MGEDALIRAIEIAMTAADDRESFEKGKELSKEIVSFLQQQQAEEGAGHTYGVLFVGLFIALMSLAEMYETAKNESPHH